MQQSRVVAGRSGRAGAPSAMLGESDRKEPPVPRFAANLSTLFTELPFLDRFAAASDAGFEAVEFQYPYDYRAHQIKDRLDAHGLSCVLFNSPPGDWAAGDRGTACVAGREAEHREGVKKALWYANLLDCPTVHVMAGVGDARDADARARYVEHLRYAAGAAAEQQTLIVIEALNPHDMPGYFLSSVRQALVLLDEIGHPNVRLQLDLYHAQRTDGDITRLVERVARLLGHVQIASVPERHEPDRGELAYPWVLRALDRAGYAGWVGCEYYPAGDTVAGLGWLDAYTTTPS